MRLAGRLVASLVLWVAAFVLAARLLDRPSVGDAARAGLVALAVAGLLPLVAALARSIRAQDEFSRRTHLVALAIAFAATGVGTFAADLLERAGFVTRVPLTAVWMGMVVVWWLALVGVQRHFAR